MGKLKVEVRKPTKSLKATKKLPLKCKRVHEFKAKLKKNIKNNKGQLIKPVSKVIQGEPKSTTREILDAPAARNLTLQSSGILDTPAIGPVSYPCKKEKKKETQKQDADAGQATTQNPYPKTIEGLVKELNDLKGSPMSREKKIHKNALRSLLARMKQKEERRRLKAAMKLAKKQKQVSRLSHTSSNMLPVVIDTVGMDMKEVNEKKETVQRKKILSKTNVTKSSKSTKNKTSSGHFKERKNNQKQDANAGRATCRKPYPKTIEGLVKELNELKETPMSVEKMFRKNRLTNRLVKKRKKEERKAMKAAMKLSKQQNLVTGLSHTNGNTIGNEKENKKQDGDEGQATTQKPYPKTIEELVQELNKLKGIPKSRENSLRMKGIENKLSKKKTQEKRKIKRAAMKLAKKQNQDTGLSLINRKDNQKQDAEGGQATSQKPYPKTIEGLVKELNELKGIPMSREKKLRKNALRSILARMKKKEKIRTKRAAEKLANKQKLVSGLSHTNSNVSPSTIDTKGINIKEDNDKKEKAVHSKQILSQINVPKQSKLTKNKISRRNIKGNLNKNSQLQKSRLKKSKNLGRI